MDNPGRMHPKILERFQDLSVTYRRNWHNAEKSFIIAGMNPLATEPATTIARIRLTGFDPFFELRKTKDELNSPPPITKALKLG
ncbi:MAG TPA: hypothetical protein VMH27_11375 [Puia sp.]|nr:hypothetical protein [Puia sp.]